MLLSQHLRQQQQQPPPHHRHHEPWRQQQHRCFLDTLGWIDAKIDRLVSGTEQRARFRGHTLSLSHFLSSTFSLSHFLHLSFSLFHLLSLPLSLSLSLHPLLRLQQLTWVMSLLLVICEAYAAVSFSFPSAVPAAAGCGIFLGDLHLAYWRRREFRRLHNILYTCWSPTRMNF